MEMDKENSQIRDEYNSYILAKAMYDRFFNELMTAVVNSMENFKKAQVKTKPDEHDIDTLCGNWYYQGKADAFREIGERLQKEHDLACQDLTNYLNLEKGDGLEEKFEKAVKNTWIMFVYRIVKEQKNAEVERILPEDDFRGRRVADKVRRIKAGLASLLEYYGWEGFQLGRKYESDRIKIEDVQDFDPKRFSDKCIETFIPEDYNNF